MPAKLKHGVIGCPGGKRDGAGRHPSWLKEVCRKAVDKHDLIGKLIKIGKGDDVETVVSISGAKVQVPAPIREQRGAINDLLDRGFGKADLKIEVNGNYASALLSEVMKALRLIPTECPHCRGAIKTKEAVGASLLELSKRFDSGEIAG